MRLELIDAAKQELPLNACAKLPTPARAPTSPGGALCLLLLA